MKDFRDSKTFALAQDLTTAVYAATDGFPEDEAQGLVGDIRGTATAIGIGIVRACNQQKKAYIQRLLRKALSSCFRLETYLLLSRDLGYMRSADQEYLQSLVEQMKLKVNRLIGKTVLGRKRKPRK
jgi:four helix bundle protein